jgi:DNA-binding ferritin-like protein
MSLSFLLSQLTALSKFHQFAHWKTSGQLSFQDHLLFERLYNETNDLIDGVAEKSVGLFGGESIDVVEDAEATTKLLASWKALRTDQDLPSVALKAVKDVIAAITELKTELGDKLTDGLANMLDDISHKLESHVYLLTQRTTKTAGISKRAVSLTPIEIGYFKSMRPDDKMEDDEALSIHPISYRYAPTPDAILEEKIAPDYRIPTPMSKEIAKEKPRVFGPIKEVVMSASTPDDPAEFDEILKLMPQPSIEVLSLWRKQDEDLSFADQAMRLYRKQNQMSLDDWNMIGDILDYYAFESNKLASIRTKMNKLAEDMPDDAMLKELEKLRKEQRKEQEDRPRIYIDSPEYDDTPEEEDDKEDGKVDFEIKFASAEEYELMDQAFEQVQDNFRLFSHARQREQYDLADSLVEPLIDELKTLQQRLHTQINRDMREGLGSEGVFFRSKREDLSKVGEMLVEVKIYDRKRKLKRELRDTPSAPINMAPIVIRKKDKKVFVDPRELKQEDNMDASDMVKPDEYGALDDQIGLALEKYNDLLALIKMRKFDVADRLAAQLSGEIGGLRDNLFVLAKEDAGWRSDAFMDEVGLKLQLLTKKLKEVELYIRSRNAGEIKDRVDHKPIGPMIRKKEPVEAQVLKRLCKLAYHMDLRGLHSEADLIDEMIASLTDRVGLVVEAKTKYKTWKGKDEKPTAGAARKAPKGWWDKQEKELKKKNPDYSAKRISEIIGNLWDNQLSHAKRTRIFKQYGKKGDPDVKKKD